MKRGQLRLWLGNYDGRREGLVYAPSKVAAARAIGISIAVFNAWWVEPSRVVQINGVGDLEPETLYTRPYHTYGSAFVKGRCPL